MDRNTQAEAVAHSYRFYQNRQCEYFPCHDMEAELLNCLFCYCPLYHEEACPGEARVVEVGGNEIKDCSRCDFPHMPDHYDAVVEHIRMKLLVRS